MTLPPDYENPPRAPSRPIVFQFPTMGIEHAEKVLALIFSAVFCLIGAGFTTVAPFQDESLRYERLAAQGERFITLGFSLGFGTGVAGVVGSIANSYRKNEDENA